MFMDLQEALKFIPNGYSIKRSEWKDIYIFDYDEITETYNTEIGRIVLSEKDKKANDWIVVWG